MLWLRVCRLRFGEALHWHSRSSRGGGSEEEAGSERTRNTGNSAEKAADKVFSASSSLGELLFRPSERFADDDGQGEMRGKGNVRWESDATRVK